MQGAPGTKIAAVAADDQGRLSGANDIAVQLRAARFP